MAGSARFTAILDANVLYPQLIRDTLLSLAVERLYHARWSATIHAEWTLNLAKDRPELAAKLPLVVERMNASVPDCLVTNYEKLANSIELPDPDDRHVVAAAIVGHADAIVTFNTKDFPATVLQPYVRNNYLRPLMRDERLAMTNPNEPSDPQQAYRAVAAHL